MRFRRFPMLVSLKTVLPMTVLLMGTLSLSAASQTREAVEVTGESWLEHLQRSFNETNMGKTGQLGPAPTSGDESAERRPTLSPGAMLQKVPAQGSDLYRFNCRGCHGETGMGTPPEIRSVINPVRATSAALVMERMKSTGMEISRADATQLAKQATVALQQRLQEGGESMPRFSYLRPDEMRSLVAYLDSLAGVPGGAHANVDEPPMRVGELIVKSTCHICHSAEGANPTPQQMLEGAIPPLGALTSRVDEAGFIRKVTHGAPVMMGDPALPERGRMPVFYYLTENEAADVYEYLTLYPPRQSAGAEQANATAEDRRGGAAAVTMNTFPPDGGGGTPKSYFNPLAMFLALGAVAGGAVLLGMTITFKEFKRLSANSVLQAVVDRRVKSTPYGFDLPLTKRGAKSNAILSPSSPVNS